MEAMRVVDRVGDQLVDRKPFEVALSANQLNIWLSGLAQIWPDAARRMPREIMEPFVAFEAGALRTAARLESGGWRAIVSSDYEVELSGDRKNLIVRLKSARCGGVPMPRFVIESILQPFLNEVGKKSVDQWHNGAMFENRFVWPNGRRPFRIGELTIEPGNIRLRIEPL